jgi:hypothetical protein
MALASRPVHAVSFFLSKVNALCSSLATLEMMLLVTRPTECVTALQAQASASLRPRPRLAGCSPCRAAGLTKCWA